MPDKSLIESVIETDVPLRGYYGIEVLSYGDGACRLSAVPPDEIVNSVGFAHGSLAFTLADTAAAYALATINLHGATINSNLAFTKPMRAGNEVIAEAEVETSGRSLATIRATVTSADTTVAHGNFQFYILADHRTDPKA